MERSDSKPRHKSQTVKPLDILRANLGSPNAEGVNKAQERLENSAVDFPPLAAIWVAALLEAIERARAAGSGEDGASLIAGMHEPAAKLRAGGAVCGYPLVVRVADTLICFLEVIGKPDEDAVELALAFHATLKALLTARITGFGGKHGDELVDALEADCLRYLKHHPENRSPDRATTV